MKKNKIIKQIDLNQTNLCLPPPLFFINRDCFQPRKKTIIPLTIAQHMLYAHTVHVHVYMYMYMYMQTTLMTLCSILRALC